MASESLPANLRKTMPAHDIRSCILNRETKRTRLEAQWSTTGDCLFSHFDMSSIGWVEKQFVYRDIGCRRWQSAIFECSWCAQTTHVVCAHAGANSFFFCDEARTTASRACTAVKHDRLDVPTRSQPQMRGLPHIAENYNIDFLKHVFCNCSDPIYADPKFGHQRFGTSCPRPLISRNSTIAGALRFGFGSQTEAISTSSDWKLEQSWHDQFDGRSKASAGTRER